ncbi:MAG: ATP-binding protein [Pseudomonadota bacterium]
MAADEGSSSVKTAEMLEIDPVLEQTVDVAEWVDATMTAQGETASAVNRMQIVCEELIVNTIVHGQNDEKSGKIRVTLQFKPEEVLLQINYGGIEFDPFHEAELPDLDAIAEDRPVGGLGVFLVRSMSETQSYERIEDRNEIRLTFERTASGPGGFDEDDNSALEISDPWWSRFQLPIRIVSVVLFVFTANLAIAGALNYLKFDRVFISGAQIRYDTVVRDVQKTVERSLGTGLSLGANRATQIAVNRTVSQHENLIELYVHSTRGELLFSSNDARPLPEAQILIEPPRPGNEFSRAADDDSFYTTGRIAASGLTIGTLTIRFDAERPRRESAELGGQIKQAAIFVGLLFVPVLALLTLLFVMPFERRFARVALAMRAQDRDAAISALEPKDHAMLQDVAGIDRKLRTLESQK